LPAEPEVIEDQKNPQQGDQQKKRKTCDEVSIENGTGANITDPYLQGYAEYESDSEEEGVFQDQLSPPGRISGNNTRGVEQNQEKSESRGAFPKRDF
jgi:hypothetical protein